MTIWAARKGFVIGPSPLEGEGSVVSQQRELGEGFCSQEASHEAAPSPDFATLLHLHALSLEGRGHSNERPTPGGRA
jgi:hypothetical protein